MIFRAIPTLEERIDSAISRLSEWGNRSTAFNRSAEGIAQLRAEQAEFHRREMDYLENDPDLLTLDRAAQDAGLNAMFWRVQATLKNSILISAENGAIERVPSWALVDDAGGTKTVNKLVVEIARDYADQNAASSPVSFCQWMNATPVTLSLDATARSLPKMGAVRTAHLDLTQEWAKDSKMLGLVVEMKYAVTLAKNGPDDYVYRTVLDAARRHLNIRSDRHDPAADALRLRA